MTNSKIIKQLLLMLAIVWWAGLAHAQKKETPRFKAIAFDYFVIFDPNSIIP